MACEYIKGTNKILDELVPVLGIKDSLIVYEKYTRLKSELPIIDFIRSDYENQMIRYKALPTTRKTLKNNGYQSSKDIDRMYEQDTMVFDNVSKPRDNKGTWEYFILKPIDHYSKFKGYQTHVDFDMAPTISKGFKRTKKKIDYSTNKYGAIYHKLENKLKQLYSDLSKATDRTVKESINKEIDATTDKLSELKDQESISAVLDLAKEELDKVGEIFAQDTVTTAQLLNVKRSIDFWIDNDILSSLFDKDEKGSLAYNKYIELKNQAHVYDADWQTLLYEAVKQRVERVVGENYSEEQWKEISKKFKKVGFAQAMFRDTSTIDNVIVQAADKIIKESNEAATLEAIEIGDEVDGLYDKVKGKLGKNFDLLNQKDSKGRSTKNLVHRFASKFFEVAKGYKPRDWKDRKQVLRYKEFKKNNMVAFDFRKLFYTEFNEVSSTFVEYTQEELDNHANELKMHLGESGYKYYMQKARIKFDNYKMDYQAKRNELKEDPQLKNDAAALEAQLGVWESQYSPVNYYKDVYENTRVFNKTKAPFKGWDYIIEVPRRYTKEGKETEYYDRQFQKIEADPDIKAYYDYLMDKMEEFKSYYPHDVTEGLPSNWIPNLPRTMLENMGGIQGMGKTLYDKLIDSLTKEDLYRRTIDETNREIRLLPTHMMGKIDSSSITESEKVQLKAEARKKYQEGTKQFNDYYKQLLEEEVQKKIDTKSFDLNNIIKAMALTSLTYKHKAQVEDSIKLINLVVHEALQVEMNPDGTQRSHKYAVTAQRDKLNDLKNSWDYLMDTFYGMHRGDVNVERKKLLSWNEKKVEKAIASEIKKNELAFKNNEITEEVFKTKDAKLKADKASLGQHLDATAVVDLLNKYVHVKGMGWNPFSAVTNAGVALISNYGYSSAGVDFDDRSLTKAYGLLFNNIFKMGPVSTNMGKKITNVMRKLNVAQDVIDSGYKSSVNKKFEKLGVLKYIMPYQLTKSVEFINQGATALAMLIHKKVTVTVNGEQKEISLFDALDQDGNWDVKKYGENPEWGVSGQDKLDFKLKLEAVKKTIHGNYDPNSPLLIKKSAFGRSLMMFRTWVPEGVASRFEKEKYNQLLGRKVKGRYRTYWAATSEDGEFISKGKVMKSLLMELGRQLTLGKTLKNSTEGFSEVDAINMKRNARELIIYTTITALGYIMAYMKADDDEDKDAAKLKALNYTLNAINRLQTDMTFYTSPISIEKITRNTLPIFDLVVDFGKWQKAAVRAINGKDGDNGAATFEQRSVEMFPPGSVYYSTKGALKKVYNN